MAVRKEAADLIKAGLGPMEVAEKMGKKAKDLVRSLLLQVGEKELRLSDIYLSIPDSRRQQYEKMRHTGEGRSSCEQSCRARNLSVEEFLLYSLSRDSLHNDMYGHLRDIEVSLHGLVRTVLEHAYPSQDDAWWYEGVPVEIRKKCAATREADSQHLEPYAYTTLINLKEIMDANWPTFVDMLPKESASNKKGFLGRFNRLNDIRNGVMHPIKPIEITEGDFRFIREFLLSFVQRPEATNLDVAEWMAKKFNEDGQLDQREAVKMISSTFGPTFVYTNSNGNLAIKDEVLAHFRRKTGDQAMWVKPQYWRKRRPADPKGKRSAEF